MAKARKAACFCQPVIWSMAAMLRDFSVVVAAVVRTRPRAIPLAMITMRKSTDVFPFFLIYMLLMGLRLAALRATGAPLEIFILTKCLRNLISKYLKQKIIIVEL